MRGKKRRFWWLLSMCTTFGMGAVPAIACTLFAPLRPLPYEADDAYRLRSSSVLEAQYDEERRSWQQGQFDRADRVFLARIIRAKSAATPDGPRRTIGVEPIRALKGTLPGSAVTVEDRRSFSCQGVVGGVRKPAEIGDYNIVFVIAPKQGEEVSIKEIPVHEARDPRLLKAI